MVKKKQKPPFSPAVMLVAVLIILVLGIFGVQVPENIQEIFGIHTQQQTKPSTTKPINSTNPGPKELGTATFSTSELTDSKNGWIDYHPLDSLGRATGADALLKPTMVNTGTSANKDIRPPGFVSGLEPTLHSRGHLIGRQLGGSGDDPRNLTTLYQTPVNTPYMTKYENQVRQALDKGETIRYRVIPVYEGTALLCKQIDLEAKGLNKHTTVDFRVTILNER
ncbi:DNA/RNA non-specific endonuclease [Enterococcus caccae]|uniref:DNA-entry nuclease n=1 Tax=Enterococcus caccae ATCC BAA-1240 TaxID=1158612 RepID=R3WEZ2_9ENTE|nr:DNA/RNA non-specific endonuclease [Enterococcus caccae]EOL45997.1 DNA-entry nuclease [Enterococcus caccae ATCC BAA-1240]EOT61193.1 DNA-entry nuclease [Enterococcus caccae ATCC BAA-1240]OJG27777.1 DNA-entry nuclease [Enterococcus caccae]